MRTHAALARSAVAPVATGRAVRTHPAVRAILRAPTIQPKLKIGAVDDPAEREADRMADEVMRMPEGAIAASAAASGTVQRICADCEDEVQRKESGAAGFQGGPATPAMETALGSLGSGAPLPASERAFFEPRFGCDFGHVRVHTGARAIDAASAVNARAFAVNRDIVFGVGEYAPQTETGRRLLSHELTHLVQQSGGRTLLQRAENDTVSGCAALTDSQSEVDTHVNASLAAARTTAGTPPAGMNVAVSVLSDLGRNVKTGRTAIEVWASTLPSTKASLPAKTATKYAGVGYRIWSNPLFPILNPTMKINGICVGSDKLGHFFQQGWTFRETEAASGSAAAEEESERSEGGGFGLTTTGVFSNADQEANRQGGKFYNDLIAAPAMTFAITSYISSRWSEVDNPNFYVDNVGRKVWANTLSGSWSGESWAGGPILPEGLSVDLTATTAGTVTGTFSLGGSIIGTISNGVTRYNTTMVRALTTVGANTTATPVSGIHIDFDWTLDSESGKGFLDSSGERQLTGRWGRGASDTDRGSWDISRT